MHLKCPGTVLLTMMMFKWGEFSLFLNTYNHRGKKGEYFIKIHFQEYIFYMVILKNTRLNERRNFLRAEKMSCMKN